MLTLGGIAVAIMIVILLLLFNVRWRLLPMLVILIGVVWAFGLAGFLGIPLTIVTIAGLPVMLGVGIDYAIQMHARVEEEAILDRSEHPIQETARNLGPALLVVTFDAIFAFAALRFAKVPMIRDFGLLLAVGIAAICICSIVMPPRDPRLREHRSPTTGKDFREGALGKIVVFLGRTPSAFAIPLAIASVVIFVWGIAVEDDLTLQTDPVQWVNQDSQSIKDLHAVEEATNSSSELGVFVQTGDVFSDENIEFVHQFTRDQLREQDGALLTGSSIETSVGDLITVPGASDIPPTGEQVRAAFEVAPDDLKASTVSPGGTDMNIVFRAGPSSLEDRAPIVQEIRDDTETPPGISLTPSGLAVVGVGLLENLEANRVLLTYLAMLFVFLFLAVRLRSIVRALLSMVPVAIAVGLASIIAWAFNLKLSPMTAVGGPLVIAACTEFTSLILLRFVEERGRGYEPARSGRCDGVPNRACVHRLRAHGHRGHRGALVLFTAAAARLRSHRRDERDGRAGERARRPAADARVGRQAQPRVSWPHQEAGAVRGSAAGALSRARRPAPEGANASWRGGMPRRAATRGSRSRS